VRGNNTFAPKVSIIIVVDAGANKSYTGLYPRKTVEIHQVLKEDKRGYRVLN